MKRPELNFFGADSRYVDRFGLLLVVTILSLVGQSLIDLRDPLDDFSSEVWSIVATLLTGSAFVLALNASGASRGWRIAAGVTVALALVATVLLVFLDVVGPIDTTRNQLGHTPLPLWAILSVLSVLLVVGRLLQHRRVSVGTLQGAIAAYLLIAVSFFFIFLTAEDLQETPFFGDPEPTTTFMYFSLVTVTTLGYGDFAASTEFTRLLTTTEAVIGQVFLVTLVAMIVGLLARETWNAGDDSANPPLMRDPNPKSKEDPGDR